MEEEGIEDSLPRLLLEDQGRGAERLEWKARREFVASVEADAAAGRLDGDQRTAVWDCVSRRVTRSIKDVAMWLRLARAVASAPAVVVTDEQLGWVLTSALRTIDPVSGGISPKVLRECVLWLQMPRDPPIYAVWKKRVASATSATAGANPFESLAILGVLTHAEFPASDLAWLLESALQWILKCVAAAESFDPHSAIESTLGDSTFSGSELASALGDKVCPLLVRLLKREKRTATRVVGPLVLRCSSSVEFDFAASTLLLPSLSAALSLPEVVPESVYTLVDALVGRVSNPEHLKSGLKCIEAVAVPTTPLSSRKVAARSLACVGSSVANQEALLILSKWLAGKDSNDEVRDIVVTSTIRLVRQSPVPVPQSITDAMGATLRGPQRLAVLRALTETSTRKDLSSHGIHAFRTLADALSTMLSTSKLKQEEAVRTALALGLLGSDGDPSCRKQFLGALPTALSHSLTDAPYLVDWTRATLELSWLGLSMLSKGSEPEYLPDLLRSIVRSLGFDDTDIVVDFESCRSRPLLRAFIREWSSLTLGSASSKRASKFLSLLLTTKGLHSEDWPGLFLAAHLAPRNSWKLLQKSLPPLSEWIDSALDLLLSPNGAVDGIKEQRMSEIRCLAIQTAALHCPSRTFERCLGFLRHATEAASTLKVDDLKVLEEVRSYEAEHERTGPSSKDGSSSKAKQPKGPRDKQRAQAELDRAKMEAQSRQVAHDRYNSLKQSSNTIQRAVDDGHNAIAVIQALTRADRRLSNEWAPNLLTILGRLGCLPNSAETTRNTFVALCRCAERPVSLFAWELGSVLYGLNNSKFWGTSPPAMDLLVRVANCLSVPQLSGEGITFISSLIEQVLLRSDDHEPDTVSAALRIVSLHVGRATWSAAVALGRSGASTWLLNILEREDGMFTSASDALIDLAETALVVGPSLAYLLQGLLSGKSVVREVTVEAIGSLEVLTTGSCPEDRGLSRALWLGTHDADDGVAQRSQTLWEVYNHPDSILSEIDYFLELAALRERDVRLSAAKAAADILVLNEDVGPSYRTRVMSTLFVKYNDNLPREVDKEHQHPRTVGTKAAATVRLREAKQVVDNWEIREGVGMVLREIAASGLLSTAESQVLFNFLCSHGLGDEQVEVRQLMVETASRAIDAAGSEGPTTLMPLIEAQLTRSPSSSEDVARADRTRENLVVCLGDLSGHLELDDPRVLAAAKKLLETALGTPSESVQRATSKCLSNLSKALSENEVPMVTELKSTLLDSTSSYGRRRGAAYALAGLLRGLGLQGLKSHAIIPHMEDCLGRKDNSARLGALMLLETLAGSFGRLFEPYVPPLVEDILVAMGDGNQEIREAAWLTSQAMMAELTDQGVRLLLPGLLSGLRERQWRTKAGSAEVLGAMAFCAPRQLAVCLPQVVPRLAETMADAHPKVKTAAEGAVSRIAAVARNPEIRQLAPFLLSALKDPSNKTKGALDAMLGTEFIHAVDPASLALLIPPIHRGLRERDTSVKKRAAAIVGSMSSHVANPLDVVPYLSLLLPELRMVLLDPIPEARRTAARALGAISSGLSEKQLPGLLDWLVEQLKDPGNTSAERSGAAIGLAELMNSLEEDRFTEVLNDVVTAVNRVERHKPLDIASAEEGRLMLFASLPFTCQNRFESCLDVSLPLVLKGLADNSDNVREAALSAGRGIVSVYGKANIDGLLPLLLGGLRDAFWRIRQSSTQLLGDFLFSISGHSTAKLELFGANASIVTAKESEGEQDSDGEENGRAEGEEKDEEDGPGSEEQVDAPDVNAEETMKRLVAVLGHNRRAEVLASLFLVRCDASLRVRQTAVQVWKRVVSNTPRTLKEVLPAIVNQVVEALAQKDEERRIAGGRALGDLAQKLGERVLPEVLPVLRRGILSEDPRLRLGSCEGLGELVGEASRTQLMEYSAEILSAVEEALVDREDKVREAASVVFSSISKSIGVPQAETIVMGLVERASDATEERGSREFALNGLERILQTSGTKLLGLVIPRLLEEQPLSRPNALALAASAKVAGEYLESFFGDIVQSLLVSIGDTSLSDAVESFVTAIAVGEQQVSSSFVKEILSHGNSAESEERRAAVTLVGFFAKHAGNRCEESLSKMYECLTRTLADDDVLVVAASWQACEEVTGNVSLDILSEHIAALRPLLRHAADVARISAGESGSSTDGVGIPGLRLTKGPAPFIPVFSHGLLQGSAELREQAALGISELVEYSTAQALGPFVIKLTGGLIRVISDRIPWQVRAGILRALLSLLEQAGPAMRAFLPQLQSTFLKNLSDTTRTVRHRSARALGALSKAQPRLEPLVKEVVSQLSNTSSNPVAVRVSYFDALRQIVLQAKSVPDKVYSFILSAIYDLVGDDDGQIRRSVGLCLASTVLRNDSVGASIVKELSERPATGEEGADQGVSLSLKLVLRVLSKSEQAVEIDFESASRALEWMWESRHESVRLEAASLAAELFLCSQSEEPSLTVLGSLANDDSSVDVRAEALKACGRAAIGGSDGSLLYTAVTRLVGLLVDAARERNTAIKHGGDYALRHMLLDEHGTERPKIGATVKRALSPEAMSWLSTHWRKLQNMPYFANGLEEDRS